MWWRQLRGWRGSVPSRMRSAERAISRWKPTASARRQKPAKRPCLAGGSPRSSRARFFTSWKARVASGPQRPDSSNAKARKVCFPGSTSGAYCWRFSASRNLAAAPIDSYVRCASTLEKHPASVVVTSRSNVRPRSSRLDTAMSGRACVLELGLGLRLGPRLRQSTGVRVAVRARVSHIHYRV